jgi:hypothetical protein
VTLNDELGKRLESKLVRLSDLSITNKRIILMAMNLKVITGKVNKST